MGVRREWNGGFMCAHTSAGPCTHQYDAQTTVDDTHASINKLTNRRLENIHAETNKSAVRPTRELFTSWS